MVESIFYVKLLAIICTSTWRIYADTILVTKDQCGRSIELVRQNVVTLTHTGEDVGDVLSPCVIHFVNNVEGDVICIRTNSSNWFNVHCQLLLTYYPQGYPSDYFDKDYSCLDFSSGPVCERSPRSAVVYTRSFFRNETVIVWLYTEKYIPTTTTTSSPRTSTSSNSYGYDNDANSTGVVVGLTFGAAAVVIILVICVAACRKMSRAQKPIYGPPATVQFTPQNNQPQYPVAQPNTLVAQNQFTPDPSQLQGYQVHAPVYQSMSGQSFPAGYRSNQNYMAPPSGISPSITATSSQQHGFSSTPNESVAKPGTPTLEPADPPPSYESLNIHVSRL